MKIIESLEEQELLLNKFYRIFDKSNQKCYKLAEKHKNLNFKYIQQSVDIGTKKQERNDLKSNIEKLKLKVEK